MPRPTAPPSCRAVGAWILALGVLATGGAARAAGWRAPVQAAPPQSHILVLAGDDLTRPWLQHLIEGFRDVVLTKPDPAVIYIESVDTSRFGNAAYLADFSGWLAAKYHDRRVDLIVGVTEDTVRFLATHRPQIWSATPILFVESGGVDVDTAKLLPHSAGFMLDLHFEPALAVIQQVLPGTERVALVYGASAVERDRFDRYAQYVRSAGLEPIVLGGLPMEELLSKVSTLPERTVVYVLSPYVDGSGRVFPELYMYERIAAAANRPSFSMPVHNLGTGVVGGLVRDFNTVGRLLAEHALLAVAAGAAQPLRVPMSSFTTLTFDGRQLSRWNVPESRLPAGSTIQFRQPNLWRDYRGPVIGALAVFALQTLLIAGLVWEHRRRRHAEAEARDHLMAAAHLDRRAVAGQLTASLTHELNQPLGAILRNAEAAKMLLSSPAPPLDEVRDIVEDIRADDKRASAVIRRLRSLLQKHELAVEPLDMNDVAQESIALVTSDARSRIARVELDLSREPCPISGDRIHLQQALLNIVLNGLDAVAQKPPGERRVLVKTASVDHSIDVSVTDTGPGIPPEVADHIFEPFFSTKAQSGGMGMGLSIARDIITAHGGRVVAENHHGQGAIVRFSLPRTHGAAL